MICEPCSRVEHQRAPRNGQDIDMEERGHVYVRSDPSNVNIVTLYQCPLCKTVALEVETK